MKESGEGEIPKQHRLDVTTVTRQMLGVFSHVARKFDGISKFNIVLWISIITFAASTSSDAIVPETEKLFMEGRIVQKLECRPYGKINVNIYIHFFRYMSLDMYDMSFMSWL